MRHADRRSTRASSSPWHFWGYFLDHRSEDLGWLWDHTWLSVVPVVVGLLLALPLGWLSRRYSWVYPPMMSITGLLYTIPSIALFVLIPPLLGLDPLSPLQVPIALSLYSIALLVRVVADGLGAVPHGDGAGGHRAGLPARWAASSGSSCRSPYPSSPRGCGWRSWPTSASSTVAGTIGFDNLGRLFDHGLQALDRHAVLPADRARHRAVRPARPRPRRPRAAGRPGAHPLAKGGAGMIGDVFGWLFDPAHWQSTNFDTGILGQLGAHVGYSAIALAIALADRAARSGCGSGTPAGRPGWSAPPTPSARCPRVGLLVLLVVIIAPHFYGRTNTGYLIPTEIVLVLLAIPPILSNTYAGVQNVEPAVRDAAFGMGMTGPQVLFRVELPNALPLIFSGLPLRHAAGDRDRHHRLLRHARRARPVHLRRPGPAGLPADDQRRPARRRPRAGRRPAARPAPALHRLARHHRPHGRRRLAGRPQGRRLARRRRRPRRLAPTPPEHAARPQHHRPCTTQETRREP